MRTPFLLRAASCLFALGLTLSASADTVTSVKINPATTKPLPASTAKGAKLVSRDEINAAALTISESAVPSLGAARSAAMNLLVIRQPGFTPADLDALVSAIMYQAVKDADADLRVQLAEMKRKNADKEAQRKAAQAAKDAARDTSKSTDNLNEVTDPDALKLQQLQNRKASLEHVLSLVKR